MSDSENKYPRFSDAYIETMHEAAWNYEQSGKEYPYGLWFFWADFISNSDDWFANEREKLTPKMKDAFIDLRKTIKIIRNAFEEGVGDSGEAALRALWNTKEAEWSRILDIQSNSLMQWDKKRNSGKKFGYAANSNSWLAFWQDKWMQRRENGKGYVVSASEIISLLPSSIAIPDESTINRHRKKLLNE